MDSNQRSRHGETLLGPTIWFPRTAPPARRGTVWSGTKRSNPASSSGESQHSVPLEMMLVEGSIRRARTDWPSGGIAKTKRASSLLHLRRPPATRRRPEGFADAGTCTSQSTARAASRLHLPRRRADSPAPPSRQIKHRKRLAQLHGGISARIHYQHSKRLQSQTGWSPLSKMVSYRRHPMRVAQK